MAFRTTPDAAPLPRIKSAVETHPNRWDVVACTFYFETTKAECGVEGAVGKLAPLDARRRDVRAWTDRLNSRWYVASEVGVAGKTPTRTTSSIEHLMPLTLVEWNGREDEEQRLLNRLVEKSRMCKTSRFYTDQVGTADEHYASVTQIPNAYKVPEEQQLKDRALFFDYFRRTEAEARRQWQGEFNARRLRVLEETGQWLEEGKPRGTEFWDQLDFIEHVGSGGWRPADGEKHNLTGRQPLTTCVAAYWTEEEFGLVHERLATQSRRGQTAPRQQSGPLPSPSPTEPAVSMRDWSSVAVGGPVSSPGVRGATAEPAQRDNLRRSVLGLPRRAAGSHSQALNRLR